MIIYGLDETGKGDIFGPLVIAGVIIDDTISANTFFKDSKSLKPGKILTLAEQIKSNFQHIIKVINPFEYNKLYEIHNNQFLLMNSIYKNIILEVDSDSINKVVIDKFSKYEINAIEELKAYDIVEVVKAESKYQAVAAASILAKAAQLEWFAKRKDLHRGATSDASSLIPNFTPKKLKYVSKLHFKPIQEFLQLYTN